MVRRALIAVFSFFTFVTTNQIAEAQNCGDERDTIIAEYTTFGVSWKPSCSDFSQTAHSDHFSFTELNNSGDFSWAVIDAALTVPETTAYGLERWRKEYSAGRIVNSAYRNPKHNNDVGGAKDSRHMYGDAADLRNESRTEAEWSNMQAAALRAKADYVEPRNGPCDIGCVHADWRNTGPNIQSELRGAETKAISRANLEDITRSERAEDRATQFEQFVRSAMVGQRKSDYERVVSLLTREALSKETAPMLIELLKRENAYVAETSQTRTPLSETYTEYYADLIGTVAALHDSRSIPPLLDSAPSGWLAIRGVAQFGEVAVGPTLEMLQRTDVRERRSASLILGMILSTRGFQSDPTAAERIRRAIRSGLVDADGYTRLNILEVAAKFPPGDFSVILRSLAKKDQFKVGQRYPVRILANRILRSRNEK